MKVLFVAYEYPPLAVSGVHRPMRFAKYLPDFGVEPIVIAPDRQSYNRLNYRPLDDDLCREIPKGQHIERIPLSNSFRTANTGIGSWAQSFFSLVQGEAAVWKEELERNLPRIINAYQPELIYVTLGPFSMGPLWSRLAQQYKLPLVFDFRDPWSNWGMQLHPTWFHYRLILGLERHCLEAASRVICATEGVRQGLLSSHPTIKQEKLITITNGYDAEVEDWSLLPNVTEDSSQYTIGYIGNFYYFPQAREGLMSPWWKKKPHRMLHYTYRREDWFYRSPYFFFRAVALLLSNNPYMRKKLRIRFAGSKPDWIDAQVNEFGLTDIVDFLGHLPYKDCLEFQKQCDCLLVTSEKISDGGGYAISLKTFEYFVARKPILGVVAEGAQKEILEKSGMACICDPDNTAQIAEAIRLLIEGQIKLTPRADFLKTLHRRELTKTLSNVFLSIDPNRSQQFN